MTASVRISFITIALLTNVHDTINEGKDDGPEYEISNFYVPCNV
jgi:hypothetical protein